jgi:hypothetical protein
MRYGIELCDVDAYLCNFLLEVFPSEHSKESRHSIKMDDMILSACK